MQHRRLTLEIYDNDISDSFFVENVTGRISRNFVFSTQLPGGFAELNVGLIVSDLKAYYIYNNWLLNRCVVRYAGAKTVWEGRLESVQVNPFNVDLGFRGYWSSCYDEVYNDLTQWDDAGDTYEADDIIKDVINVSCPCISADVSNIASPGRDLTPIRFDNDQRPGDVIKKVLSLGDTSEPPDMWYAAVWEDRIMHVFERADSAVKWVITKGDLVSQETGFTLGKDTSKLYNKVRVYYSDSISGRAKTAWAEDEASQDKYVKRVAVMSTSGATSLTALGLRDAYLEEHKEPMPACTIEIQGVSDIYGARRQLFEVRAGDVLRIGDFYSVSSFAVSGSKLDRDTTVFIIMTNYNALTDRLQLTLDTEGHWADILLARAGLSGMRNM